MNPSTAAGASTKPVTISFSALLADSNDPSLRSDLRRAFGSEQGCLGIVLVRDLPDGFGPLRENLFHLAHRFATMPEQVRETLSQPDNHYMFGWSHGKEVMNGRPDTQKGSYYANPLVDRPIVSEELKKQHPEYYAGNVWPAGMQDLEEFEPTFKALGKIIFDVGCALARACESFVERPDVGQSIATLESLIANSKSNKARLLHYYPETTLAKDSSTTIANDALCGTHIDHSLLTGLCSAMYLSQSDPSAEPIQVPPPNSTAGLYIYPRSPDRTRQTAIKVQIPPDCLAYQTGETLELLTSGRLAATPHFVSGSPSSDETSSISRETFAFFLQPDVDDVIGQDGETFGQFTKRVLSRHYGKEEQSNLPEEAEN